MAKWNAPKRVRKLRKQENWTLRELGRRAGVTYECIRKLEAGGDVTTKTLKKIADAFKVDLVTLVA